MTQPTAEAYDRGSQQAAAEIERAYDAGVAEGRRQAAAEIRSRAADIGLRAEALAGTDGADGHPFTLGCEFAARVAEGS